ILHMHNRHLVIDHDSSDKKNLNSIKKSDLIICVSHFIRQDIIKKFPQIDQQKLHVIYNALKIEKKQFSSKQKEEIKKQLGLPVENDVLLYVGRIVPEKGLTQLIEAFLLM